MHDTAYETIRVDRDGPVARLWLNRPDVHNAFNAVMIRELRSAVRALGTDGSVRVVILSGQGASFCAGADLNWMKEVIHFSYKQNLRESLDLAEFLHELYVLPKPTIARVNGAAIGGGAGFLSACDIVIASTEAKFGLSEVKLGLVPACIAPYVLRKTGERWARQYFLTGERIDAERAREIGLANAVVGPDKLDRTIDDLTRGLISSGPEALAQAKELLSRVPGMTFGQAKRFTAEMIAKLRMSSEGQEGMAAFLEKRKPRWIKS
ncbi:MAG: enoyl-CoA hydratase/isomerase family protein [Candidatus Aminicenantes bacterium]|nr:enoyl-CoA hydratase/isomerase family protein [Candidatus Aminicenantes bacterium]